MLLYKIELVKGAKIRIGMKKLFNAIKKQDLDTVIEILEHKPDLISSVAKQPPKSDDGKSLLQVAIKDGTIEIANYLLSKGADVNFIEAESSVSGWRMPVIQDALANAIIKSRWCSVDKESNAIVQNTKKEADEAFELLKRMVSMGANLDVVDSYGNTTMERATMESQKILPHYNYVTGEYTKNRKITEELRCDLTRIFHFLYENGLTSHIKMRTSEMTVNEFYSKQPLAEFLND